MKILCVLGKFNYGSALRGESYEYVNFLPAFRRLGHEVIFFDSLGRDTYRDFADLNRQFLDHVLFHDPDIIFCSLMHYELWSETLQWVRNNTHSILINWSTDDSWKYRQFSALIAENFHIYATTYKTAMASAPGDGHSNFVLTQWAANSENLIEPSRAIKCRYPVTFIGSAYGDRQQYVSSLQNRGIEVKCFGHGWERGAIPAADIPRIINQSLISLNFGDSGLVMNGVKPTRSRQIKARIFEVPGAGGFLMTENADDLSDWYTAGKEIEVYEGISVLEDKIRYYLAHPEERDAIAIAGHQRTVAHHTYEMRFRGLLDRAALLVTREKRYVKGAKSLLVDSFSQIEEQYKIGLVLRMLKWILIFLCKALWGPGRGLRAARRILFEISWRIMGKKTYSVSGWPGRLFYHES